MSRPTKDFSRRCPKCRVLKDFCFCSQMNKVNNRIHLLLLVHHREWRKPTNSGFLPCAMLANSSVALRGSNFPILPHLDPFNEEIERVQNIEQQLKKFQNPMVLTLDPHAKSLEECLKDSDWKKPDCLIVPDGSWRQASKTARRENEIKKLPRIFLLNPKPSQYRLRRESREVGLGTAEAVAQSLAHLESAELGEKIEAAFNLFVQRSLWGREIPAKSSSPTDDAVE